MAPASVGTGDAPLAFSDHVSLPFKLAISRVCIKSTAVSDGQGRLLWLGAFRPGRMHDVTALRTDGIEDLLRRHPDVQAEADVGSQGLACDFPGQVSAPPKKPCKLLRPGRGHRPLAGNSNATSSHPSGSAPGTPSPSPGSGGPCNAGPDAASTSRKPLWPSPDLSPTAPPRGNHTPAIPPGQHILAPIVHLLVRAGCRGHRVGNGRRAAGPAGPERVQAQRGRDADPPSVS
jgi:hypothetical protein